VFAAPLYYGRSEIGVPAGAVLSNVAVGDLNSDGRQDLLTSVYWDYCGPGCRPAPGGGFVLLSRPSGGFVLPGLGYAQGSGNLGPVTVADVNNDGRADVVARLRDGSEIWVWLGRGDGTFQAERKVPSRFSEGLAASFLTVGDFTGDGRSDLAVVYDTGRQQLISVLPGDGTGSFQQGEGIFTQEERYRMMAAADFNHDGRSDLVLRNVDSSSLTLLLSRADGSFRSPAEVGADSLRSGDIFSDVFTFQAMGDFNRDGSPDLAYAAPNQISVFLGRGDAYGNFQSPVYYDPGTRHLVGLATADLDGNGSLDLAVLEQTDRPEDRGRPAIRVLRGNCDGTFQPAQGVDAINGIPGLPELTLGDVNGDGKPDLVLNVRDLGQVLVFMNQAP
jgi:hypothetical protein